jgi:hypothetical protein
MAVHSLPPQKRPCGIHMHVVVTVAHKCARHKNSRSLANKKEQETPCICTSHVSSHLPFPGRIPMNSALVVLIARHL